MSQQKTDNRALWSIVLLGLLCCSNDTLILTGTCPCSFLMAVNQCVDSSQCSTPLYSSSRLHHLLFGHLWSSKCVECLVCPVNMCPGSVLSGILLFQNYRILRPADRSCGHCWGGAAFLPDALILRFTSCYRCLLGQPVGVDGRSPGRGCLEVRALEVEAGRIWAPALLAGREHVAHGPAFITLSPLEISHEEAPEDRLDFLLS